MDESRIRKNGSKYEEGLTVISCLDGRIYRVKKVGIGSVILEEREGGIELKMGISALELFFHHFPSVRG